MKTVLRILAIGLLACVVSPGQIHYASGQGVVPVYEGWERNPDGSFNMVFGYFNRNYEEEVDIPVGPDNKIEPGAPDQGQPSHFYPRRQEFVFKVKVPADWGEKDLVWTLNFRGKTEKTFGTLVPLYELANLVYLENRKGAGALTFPEEPNAPPAIEMVGSSRRTLAPGEPLTLSVDVTDDGYPKPIVRKTPRDANRVAAGDFARQPSPATQAIVKLDPGVRLGVTWVVYRGGPGTVNFDPIRSAAVKPASTGTPAADGPIKGRATTTVTFSKPGNYVLRAYADDGILTTPQDILVTVR
ncbi:MAG: hypothetical protein QOJ99_3537 [Bryobacterales bacterium]|nr:hypothetical protein [Bryobacterales bacterium]